MTICLLKCSLNQITIRNSRELIGLTMQESLRELEGVG